MTSGIIVDMSLPEDIATQKPAWSGEDLVENPHCVSDKARRVEEMFTVIARSYDFNNRIHSIWQDQVWRRRAVKMANVTPTDIVVDVACGTGDLAMAFYAAGVHSVTGFDFTQAMLDIAIAKAAKSDLRITYELGDAMALRIPSDSTDIVSIAFGIRNVQYPEKALAEFYRILKNGGRVVILEFSNPSSAFIRKLNNVYTKHIMPLTASIIARDTSGAYKYLPKSVESFISPAQLAIDLKEVGFCDVMQAPQTFGVCTITTAYKR